MFTCPYCQCKYRIPIKCQNIKIGVVISFSLTVLMLYMKVSPWVFEHLFGGSIIQKIIDGVALLFVAFGGVELSGKIGEKMAYRYPLEKIE